MARIFCLLTFLCFSPTVFAQQDPYPVYLFGNTATKPLSPESYTLLKQEITNQKQPFTIIHLGDIALNKGWPENPKPEDALRLEQLVDLVKDNPKGKIIFIPGDKDWNNSGKDGLKAVKRLEKYLQSRLPYKNGFVPGSGCPGPEVLDVNPFLRIVAINSGWWMHPFDKPEVTDTDCKILTRQEFVEELQEEITEADNRNVLVVGHHPVFSNGVYGGNMTLKKHIFPLSDKNPRNRIPLPVFGTVYAAYRQNIGTPRDLSNFRYEAFRDELGKIFKQNPGLIYASAHEYNLQLNYSDETYHLISGSLTEKESVGKSPETMFSAAKIGFTKLEYFPNGEVKVQFLELNRDRINLLNTQTLLQSPCTSQTDSIAPANRFFIPCTAPDSIPDTYLDVQNGKVTVVPGRQYKANWFKKIFFGKLYRSTWTTPVEIPLLDLKRTYGGLKPVSRGGGRQTISLHFEAENGENYVFRSVDKDPIKALPIVLRETFVTNVLRDITATSQPFGALIIASLLDSTNILHARPNVYVLPNHEALGPYRTQYAGLLGMLEEHPKDPKNGKTGFAGADDAIKTYSLFRKLYDDHNNQLDVYAFGKARAFDIWVGDFGRHGDNWRWAGYQNEHGGRIYKPIPRDRDQAFTRWDGFFPWLADLPFGVKTIQNFGADYKGIRSLTHPARYLDRALLQNLTRQDWQNIARELQTEMTEATIDKAIQAQPKEVIPVSGNLIGYKLKKRIAKLPDALNEYYENLALEVDVVGSNKEEYYKVERLADHSVHVQMFRKGPQNDQPAGDPLFNRIFYPNETNEIRIFALGGNDVIEIFGLSESSILVRVIGGEGDDIIRDYSMVPGRKHYTRVYDVPQTRLELGPEAKDLTSNAQNINAYNRHEFRYNYLSPIPGLVYNRSDGLGASITLKLGRFLFREPEEKRIYTIDVRGTQNGAFQVTGGGIWNNVWKTWGTGGSISFGSYFPHYNFFGLGNNTKKDDKLYEDLYYRARYKGLIVNGFTQTRFLRKSTFRIGPLYENLISEPQNGTVLNEETARSLITGKESLLGGQAELDFDLRDKVNFTTRGLRFRFSHTTYQRLTRGKNAFGLTSFSGQYFGTANLKIPVTLALKLGGAQNYGKDLPFYKYTSLGLNDNLRGYVNNRFFGDRSAYLNTELRFHLGRVRTSILPFYYGAVAFYDQGKVWYQGSDAGGLHQGYGAGFYLAPIEHRYALNVLFGHSKEETLLLQFSLGLVLDR